MGFKNNCCNHHEDDNCRKPSSGIVYDGASIPEAGVRHGDSLNTVIENVAAYVARSISVAGAVRVESFRGTNSVRLEKNPAEILMVVYCGGVLPENYYRTEGRTIKFCSDFCRGDDFADVQIVYREKNDSSYGFNC